MLLKMLMFLFLFPALHGSYYSYDLRKVDSESPYVLTWEEIVYWDNQAKEAAKLSDDESISIRLQTYLRSAEDDFADLSHKISGEWKGSVGPLAKSLIEMMVPTYTISPRARGLEDSYSQTLSRAIFEKYKERHLKEGVLKPYTLNPTATSWKGKEPYYGITLGNLSPWVIGNVQDFRAHTPPESLMFWKLQADEVLRERSEVKPKEVAVIEYWGGPKGSYADLVDEYMYEKNLPLNDRLRIRAELARLTSDTIAAMFDSKYTYLVPRPEMINKEIATVIPCPNHPSYPSGHSSVSAMTATYLSHQFPENKEKWWRIANECGMSRVLGGLHYQIDHVGGQDLGVRIANKSLSNQ